MPSEGRAGASPTAGSSAGGGGGQKRVPANPSTCYFSGLFLVRTARFKPMQLSVSAQTQNRGHGAALRRQDVGHQRRGTTAAEQTLGWPTRWESDDLVTLGKQRRTD